MHQGPAAKRGFFMSYLDAVILGLLQGLTEFLPISSSGHLVLAQELLGVNSEGVTFEILVHLGSLLAIFIYFRSKLWSLTLSLFSKDKASHKKEILFLAMATVPAALVGVFFESFIDSVFSSALFTSSMLIVTGFILLSTRLTSTGSQEVDGKRAILIGLAQSLAILPGISRSGSTIAIGLLLKIEPSKAAEFSFLLAIPAIIGATIFKFDDILASDSDMMLVYLAGAMMAFVSSLAAIRLLMALIRKGRFEYFAYYCFAAGASGWYLFS